MTSVDSSHISVIEVAEYNEKIMGLGVCETLVMPKGKMAL